MSGPLYQCDRCPETATMVAAEDIFIVNVQIDDNSNLRFALCLACKNELADFTKTGPKLESQTKYGYTCPNDRYDR